MLHSALGRGGMLVVPMLLLAAAAGCERGPAKQGVTGTVTFNGAALPKGLITFYPLTTDLQAGTTIEAGKFVIERDKGLTPGTYRVTISSPEEDAPVDTSVPPGPTGQAVSKERIPPAFNLETKLEVEITAAGPNHFDFTIP